MLWWSNLRRIPCTALSVLSTDELGTNGLFCINMHFQVFTDFTTIWPLYSEPSRRTFVPFNFLFLQLDQFYRYLIQQLDYELESVDVQELLQKFPRGNYQGDSPET